MLENLVIDNVIIEITVIDESLLNLPKLHNLPQFRNRIVWEVEGTVCISVPTFDIHPSEVIKILQGFNVRSYAVTAKRCYTLPEKEHSYNGLDLTVERCDDIVLNVWDQDLPLTLDALQETINKIYIDLYYE